ncbi:LysR family transcriptional regulator [Giesbergeria sinuosa]|uniref:LysR family transcriptional regulator n=1 Tax=Giesbergeria sinuosa TaxID=80883 RepID=A0ABV9QFM9_9BURK
MDLRHLKYFVAVAEERSFTRAAERLHISQPPLSRQIQQLEEAIGQPLIDREARPLHLTEAGRFFYARAVRLLEQFHETIAMTRRIAQTDKRLVLGFAASTMYGALPHIVRMFRATQPHTELVLLERTSVQQIEDLNAGRIDVGFGRIRLESPNVKREVLRKEPLVLAMPCEHPLASDSSPLSLTAIKPYPLLIYPRQPRPSYADQVLSICHDLGIEPGTVHEVNEMQTALGLVASGMGLCVVPSGVQKLRREDVLYRPLMEPSAVSPIIMSTRLHDRPPDLLLLRTLIDEVYQEGVYPGQVAAPVGASPGDETRAASL